MYYILTLVTLLFITPRFAALGLPKTSNVFLGMTNKGIGDPLISCNGQPYGIVDNTKI